MADIDPADLSRTSFSLTTPILSAKSLPDQSSGPQKANKASQVIPFRIDLEPLYTALKLVIGGELWLSYKDATTKFLLGRMNQSEFTTVIDPILASSGGEKERLHNQLIAAVYGNVTREMPDSGLAPWVSANDKLVPPPASKPVTGDAAERRLKGDVMQLPSRDRRRIKNLVHNDYDPTEAILSTFLESHGRFVRTPNLQPQSAGLNNMNLDLEIRKRYLEPLAVESGEFPDLMSIKARLLPTCLEIGLIQGYNTDVPSLLTIATELFVKEVLSGVLSRTRCNGPGDTTGAFLGAGTDWIKTRSYRRQLAREEDAFARGELRRDKVGLLPAEAKATSERGPLDNADFRLSLEISENGLCQFPIISSMIRNSYRVGELEYPDEYSYLLGAGPSAPSAAAADHGALILDAVGTGATSCGPSSSDPRIHPGLNGTGADQMDVDSEPPWWEGTEPAAAMALDNMLDMCLAAGSWEDPDSFDAFGQEDAILHDPSLDMDLCRSEDFSSSEDGELHPDGEGRPDRETRPDREARLDRETRPDVAVPSVCLGNICGLDDISESLPKASVLLRAHANVQRLLLDRPCCCPDCVGPHISGSDWYKHALYRLRQNFDRAVTSGPVTMSNKSPSAETSDSTIDETESR